uniref:Glutamate--cysteine ligase n=1 Tax=Panagrolaimus sp. PS1159 TaxID=55785 RepID=A0AC35GI80_9BILA
MEEAKWLYDQLAPITPILSALSAATPIHRSYLSEVDSRWNIISQGNDDRTPEERGEMPLKDDGKFFIEKSRYDCFSCYLHETSQTFNDIEVKYDEKHFQQLLSAGIEEPIAQHIAHMFIRDPLIVLKDHINEDYEEGCTDHLDFLQTSVWNNMRFKPPPSENSEIGWRVEFRPTEIQLTDFENAALSCFVVLLTRVIISYNLVFVTNISTVNENMQRAIKRDAILNEKLQFRNKLVTCEMIEDGKRKVRENGENEVSTAEMTVNEIINGDGKEFPGLIPLIFQFLDEAEVDTETRNTITQYLTFIQNRASGKILTLAKWMRNYVQKHPKYAKDSYVPDETIYDMIKNVLSYVYLFIIN